MSAEYEIHLLEAARDNRLAVIDHYANLRYAKRVNDIGSFTIEIGPENFDYTMAHLDGRLVVWRKPSGGARYIDFAGFVRDIKRQYIQGRHQIVLSGPCYNELLERRIARGEETQPQVHKIGFCDDVMKEIMDENFGTTAAANRDIETPGYLSIQADVSACTAVRKDFPMRNIFRVLQELGEQSAEIRATACFFGVVPLNSGWDMEFRTNVQRWNQDHRHPGGIYGPVIFALERGNMQDPALSRNYREEITLVYGGGEGKGRAREIVEIEDAARSGLSPLNRRESFFDGRQYINVAMLEQAAEQLLNEGVPQVQFDYKVVDVPGTIYGLHWNFGDLITASYAGEQYDFHVTSVDVTIANAEETIDVRLEHYA